MYALWSGHAGSALEVPLRLLSECCALWSWLPGAAAGCRCKLPAGAGYYCQRAVCILGTWVLLQSIGVRMRCALWSWGVLRDVYGSVRLGVAKKYLLLSGAYASVIWYRHTHTHKYTLVIKRGTWPYKWRFIAWKINYNREIFHCCIWLPEGS